MKELYGYKEKDVIELMQYVGENEGKSLSEIFSKYALFSGKAKGTVRNLYYAIVKKAKEDNEFCDKYLKGKLPKIQKTEKFSAMSETRLLKSVLTAKSHGKSVRETVMSLGNGDGKLALRYQNKYRNLVRNDRAKVEKIIKELAEEGINVFGIYGADKKIKTELPFIRLKREIDAMLERISEDVRKENYFLKQRICILERENYRLKKENANGIGQYFLPIKLKDGQTES